MRKEDDAVRQPMCHSYLWRLVPDRGGLGLVAGSASLVRFPGTREPSFAPLLPARLSLPTDPETIQIVKNASIFLFVISVFRWNLAPPHLTSSSLCCFLSSYCSRRASSSRAERYRESWALWNSMIWSNMALSWFKSDWTERRKAQFQVWKCVAISSFQ